MRIAAFDLETSGLEGDWASILCASFCPIKEEGKIEPAYTLTRKVRSKDPFDDAALAAKIKAEIAKYNLIVTWNGKMFDIPFLNSRLLKAGLESVFPQLHVDIMWFARGNAARLASSKMVNVGKFFRCKTEKYDVPPHVLIASRAGDAEALKEVIIHCEADVQLTTELYWKLLPGIRQIHRAG